MHFANEKGVFGDTATNAYRLDFDKTGLRGKSVRHRRREDGTAFDVRTYRSGVAEDKAMTEAQEHLVAISADKVVFLINRGIEKLAQEEVAWTSNAPQALVAQS
jgi:hypothetical protein